MLVTSQFIFRLTTFSDQLTGTAESEPTDEEDFCNGLCLLGYRRG